MKVLNAILKVAKAVAAGAAAALANVQAGGTIESVILTGVIAGLLVFTVPNSE